MLKTIIIDDEKKGREIIKELLTLYCSQVTVVGEAEGVVDGIALIRHSKPDIVLLDIQMQDGTGFDLLKQFQTIDFKIIFITAHEEHAIKAFQFSALDYVLKPVLPHYLISAIDKAEDALEKENITLKINALLNNVNNQSNTAKKIVLKTAERIYVVNVNTIIRCEADGSYTHFYLNDGKNILVSKVLKEFEELLNESNFFRVHQSHLVNLDYLDYFEKGRDSVMMKDKSSIPVATRKKEFLLKLIDQV